MVECGLLEIWDWSPIASQWLRQSRPPCAQRKEDQTNTDAPTKSAALSSSHIGIKSFMIFSVAVFLEGLVLVEKVEKDGKDGDIDKNGDLAFRVGE